MNGRVGLALRWECYVLHLFCCLLVEQIICEEMRVADEGAVTCQYLRSGDESWWQSTDCTAQ